MKTMVDFLPKRTGLVALLATACAARAGGGEAQAVPGDPSADARAPMTAGPAAQDDEAPVHSTPPESTSPSPTPEEVAAGLAIPWEPSVYELREALPSARRLESGLIYQRLRPGDGGPPPRAQDHVEVHYVGWKPAGEQFDSSRERERPLGTRLDQVIPGWTEGLQLMSPGEIARFWIPEELAYAGKREPFGALVFDIELLAVERLPAPPLTPADVAAPPPDATITASGLAYKRLSPGEGEVHPTADDSVRVHYSGWTTDGELFDSSITRGRSTRLPLRGVIPGWTEGLQLMTVGERALLWIPEDLAYKGKPGRPAGMLVFEIELLAIE